jgi:peptidoglycan/xylan/chitin deacetylase (PgdA/CDA1 family)
VVAEPLHRGRGTAGGPPGGGRPHDDPGRTPHPPPSPATATAPVPDLFAVRAPWTLMYHSVDAYREDPYQVTVTPERFARQMEWLCANGLRGVALGELLRAHANGTSAGLVGLTFDDGYADLPREVLPVLERHGFTATAFVVVGRLGGHNVWDEGPRKQLLTPAQVRHLADCGVEIGSHGRLHRPLPGLPPEELALETRQSREQLEDIVERRVSGFCYPYGAVDAPAAASVRDSGYSYAAAIAHSPLTGRWALPRSYVGERDNGVRLRAKQVRHRMRGLRARSDEEGAR